ncbi:hypothetical protein EYF80_021720 [Liparis tanakae]|uniref:Uncharacterized protein n=1 Tax=Liparis tanakae TaxID=230148 RepID=A0A4Z2HRY4_9TELE|nr:hypothetical protein EYF80_021720 [Liparis tanakae]
MEDAITRKSEDGLSCWVQSDGITSCSGYIILHTAEVGTLALSIQKSEDTFPPISVCTAVNWLPAPGSAGYLPSHGLALKAHGGCVGSPWVPGNSEVELGGSKAGSLCWVLLESQPESELKESLLNLHDFIPLNDEDYE